MESSDSELASLHKVFNTFSWKKKEKERKILHPTALTAFQSSLAILVQWIALPLNLQYNNDYISSYFLKFKSEENS